MKKTDPLIFSTDPAKKIKKKVCTSFIPPGSGNFMSRPSKNNLLFFPSVVNKHGSVIKIPETAEIIFYT